jgi:Zn-dependent M28 family amino/carboxypeptidase
LKIPALEISEAAATRILGQDVAALAASIERSGKPLRIQPGGVKVSLESGLTEEDVQIDNIVGILRGTDPALAAEHVVLGAHYDHIGVDVWGRIGCGADDNASGTAGLIELAEAFALSRPARSLIFAFFGAEEDGLIGSQTFCKDPPVPLSSIVAMLNMDMIGLGKADELIVLGTDHNPWFEDVLKEAKKLRNTQVKKVITDQEQQLWERSDHAAFHAVGVPSLFFFEGKEADNPDYHTYRDTLDDLSLDKITRTTRFVFNTAWLIANAPERPPAPR